ncbi:Transposase DDE domain-containing protein [Stigmatella aurantiaca]|uniref:Transposase DDE domain-containing protein n=2 Tax=Stigmatella aurantiaca TaxID=41 RepID=A0A1H8FXY3_STIAU|nr:Transposase DDE domain-containing protein [Stigmatella aurantiaca]
MAFDAVLERFVKNSPVSVMARLVLQRVVSAEWMDSLFEAHRKRQYTRELLFSTVVELMSVVAMGLRPSLHAAAKATEVGTSVAALYEKVNRMEPGLVRALVRGSAQRLEPVVQPLRTGEKPWAEGYRIRVMDGNHLPASEKRLKPLREFRGAALPGHSLVVYAPAQGLVVDVVPCEDAHAQERTLVAAVLEHAQQGDLWIADRNFSTTRIVFGLEDRHAAFIIREHGRTPSPTEVGKRRRVGRVETGVVFEQPVQVEDDGGRQLTLRRIELQLDEPTEEGEPLIRLLTNAPEEKLSAEKVACLYRKRWSIEGMFQSLESALHSEVRTLGHPRAALLAFGTAVVAYNILAVIQAAVEAAHPEAKAEGIELSPFFVATEVQATYGGMMIAVGDDVWTAFDEQSPLQLSRTLVRIAQHAQPKRLRKHLRGPKKKTKKGYVSGRTARQHVATARVLASGRIDSTS